MGSKIGSHAVTQELIDLFAPAGHTHLSSDAHDVAIYDNGAFKATGTIIDFGENLAVSVTGTSVFVDATAGGGTITGSGTVDRVAKFTSITAIGDSTIVDCASGTVISPNANVFIYPTENVLLFPSGTVSVCASIDVDIAPNANVTIDPGGNALIFPSGSVSIYPNGNVTINPGGYVDIRPTGTIDIHPTNNVDIYPIGNVNIHPTGTVNIYPNGNIEIFPTGSVNIYPNEHLRLNPIGSIDIGPSGTVYIHTPTNNVEIYPQLDVLIHPTAGWTHLYGNGKVEIHPNNDVNIYPVGNMNIYLTGTVSIIPTGNVDIHPIGEVTIDAANSITLQQDTYVEENLYVSGSVFTDSFTDYSSISQIIGWASFTTQQIYYMKIGKLVIVEVALIGTSDNTRTNFTVPYAPLTVPCNPVVKVVDGGTNNFGHINLPAGSVTGTCFPDSSTTVASWIATGTKTVRGTLMYITE